MLILQKLLADTLCLRSKFEHISIIYISIAQLSDTTSFSFNLSLQFLIFGEF